MKLSFQATQTEMVVGVTGDNGYSSQKLDVVARVVNGDTLSVTLKPNPYLPPTSPWRLLTEDGRVLPWLPDTDLKADDIIDYFARDLARRRSA